MSFSKKIRRALNIFLCQRMDINYLYWFLVHAPKIDRFKNIHKGQDCFIIGNGPSLNKMDLTLLKDYYTFGLNKIFLLFDKIDLNLSYHVAVNPYVIKQSKTEIESLTCPSFLSYMAAKKLITPKPHIHFLATGPSNPSFKEDSTNILSEGWTVTFVALQLAFYLGFRRVFLIGVDHNFKVSGRPNEAQELSKNDVNHFDPNYFKGHEWQLPDLQGSEISYHLAQFYFERAGRAIYDATVDGKLNVFQKISFKEALNQCCRQTKNQPQEYMK